MSSIVEKTLITFLKALGRLPINWRQRIGDTIGYLVDLVPSRERAVAIAQLKRFLPEADARSIVRGLHCHLGRVAAEVLNLGDLPSKVIVENSAELDQFIADRSTPVIALTAHLGNWELTAAHLIYRRVDLAAVGRITRNNLAHSAIDFLRKQYGLKMLWRIDRAGVGDIIESLKQNAWIGSLIDQDTQVSGINVPFFGQMSHTPVTIIRLGKRYNARFITCFVLREPSGSYRGYFKPLDPHLDEVNMLEEYHRRLESLIRLYPEQWVWFHKRWRTQANGERLSTARYLEWLAADCPNTHTGAASSSMSTGH